VTANSIAAPPAFLLLTMTRHAGVTSQERRTMKSEAAGILFKLKGGPTPEEWRESAERARDEIIKGMRAGLALPPSAELAGVANAFRDMGSQMAAALRELTRPDGYFALAVKQAEEARRELAEWLAALPEEERDELRRLAEDAPLCPVDVSASNVM
jgi:hypothetical protein